MIKLLMKQSLAENLLYISAMSIRGEVTATMDSIVCYQKRVAICYSLVIISTVLSSCYVSSQGACFLYHHPCLSWLIELLDAAAAAGSLQHPLCFSSGADSFRARLASQQCLYNVATIDCTYCLKARPCCWSASVSPRESDGHWLHSCSSASSREQN